MSCATAPAAEALAALHRRWGQRAVLRAAGTGGTVAQAWVLVAELPAARVQQRYGQDDVRMADIAVLRSDAPEDPSKDATLELADGPQAGTWIVLGVERTDELCAVVRCRRATRANAAAPGAREVRR